MSVLEPGDDQARLLGDLAGMRRLFDLYTTLTRTTDLVAALEAILAVAVEFVGTDRGSVQLVSADGERLQLVAQHGHARGARFVAHPSHATRAPRGPMKCAMRETLLGVLLVRLGGQRTAGKPSAASWGRTCGARLTVSIAPL